MTYPGLSQTLSETSTPTGEFMGLGNPVLRYSPMAGRADRLPANIVGGGEVDRLSAGGYTAASTNKL